MVEKDVFVAGLDWVAEEIFAAGIAECDELLSVFLDTLRADWSDVVIADAFSHFPLKVVALITMTVSNLVSERDVTGGKGLIGGGGSAGGNSGAGRRAHMSSLSLLHFAGTQTRQGCR